MVSNKGYIYYFCFVFRKEKCIADAHQIIQET